MLPSTSTTPRLACLRKMAWAIHCSVSLPGRMLQSCSIHGAREGPCEDVSAQHRQRLFAWFQFLAEMLIAKVEEGIESSCKRSHAVSAVAPDDGHQRRTRCIRFSSNMLCGKLEYPKGTARTMRKAQKKVVTRGVLDLHYHAALLSHRFGLSSFASSPDPDNVFFAGSL